MNNKITTALILALSISSAYAKPPAKDSVHGGGGRALLDNITPNALGGGNSGGGRWTGYEHLKGKNLSISLSCQVGGLFTFMARVDDLGNPYIRCSHNGGGLMRNDTGWRLAENCNTTLSAQAALSPRGLSATGPASNPTCYNSAAW